MAAPSIGSSTATIYFKDGDTWYDAVHPVNSFYFSVSNTSPADLFGGTWTQISTPAAIRAVDSDTKIGYVGSDTHTLTEEEMPSHSHDFWGTEESSTTTAKTWTMYVKNRWGSSEVWTANGNTSVTLSTLNTSAMIPTGGGQSHSILQSSFNCYVWYRTA